MKKAFVLIISIVIFLCVFGWIISLFIYDRGIKRVNSNYPDINYQTEASIILKQREIRHKIDHEGVLRYNKKDEKTIRDAYDEVKKKHIPDWPNIYWADKRQKKILLRFLITNNIPYVIRKLDDSGNDYIMWEPSFDEKVQKINDQITSELKNNLHKFK